MSASYDWKEVKAEITKLNKIPDQKKVLDYAAKRFKILMSKYANVDSGAYVDSWKPKIVGDTLKITTPKGQLFQWLEFTGTVPHIIVPVRANVLHWIDKETGGHRFAMKVHHPGTQATPHVRKVMKMILKEIQEYWFKIAKQELTWLR